VRTLCYFQLFTAAEPAVEAHTPHAFSRTDRDAEAAAAARSFPAAYSRPALPL